MEPKCKVCQSERRENIDIVLASGASYRDTADSFGFSHAAMYRHRSKHMKPKVSKEQAKQIERKVKHAEQRHQEVIENVWATRLDAMYQAAADGVARAAADDDKWYMGASFIGQAVKAIDVGMRASGEIAPGGTINVGQMLILPTQPAPSYAPEIAPARKALPEPIDAEPCDE